MVKDVKGYEGLYSIDENGNIYSYKSNKRMKHWIDGKTGYYFVRLHKDGKARNHPVHRLLAIAFINNPEGYPTVDHINRDRLDNRLENLRWASFIMQAANQDRSKLNEINRQRMLNKNINPSFKYLKVFVYDINGDFIKEYSREECKAEIGKGVCKINTNKAYKKKFYFFYRCDERAKEVAEKRKKNMRKCREDRDNSKVKYATKRINQYTLNGKFIRTFNSISEAALFLNKPKESGRSNIIRCLKGKYESAYGFLWKYAD